MYIVAPKNDYIHINMTIFHSYGHVTLPKVKSPSAKKSPLFTEDQDGL